MSKGNEPAYPAANAHRVMRDGLTKRELFAAMAMQGLLSRDDCRPSDASKDSAERAFKAVAIFAVHHADALLSALEAQ